jgi:alpha-tubulin suppressor-like RCC1 family protein
VRIAAIAAGNQHSLALSEDSQVFAWGHGQFGALGLGQGAQFKQQYIVATGYRCL